MKKHYYFIGSIVGLLVAMLIASILMGKAFLQMLSIVENQSYNGIVPILIGCAAVIATSIWCDLKFKDHRFLKAAIVIPTVIYMVGIIFGCASNVILNANTSTFFEWFVKPLLALSLSGIPGALLIGVSYFFINKFAGRK